MFQFSAHHTTKAGKNNPLINREMIYWIFVGFWDVLMNRICMSLLG